jgi:dihydrofolate synthase/folylpolyglutamate synthase
LDNEPFTICDTAHNREGLEIVLAQIKRIPKSDLHIVLGFVNDKDLDSVLPLFPVEANYYFTRASVPRALNEDILKEAASKYGLSGECFPDVLTALARARKKSAKSDLIFIGGSTFVVGDVIKR